MINNIFVLDKFLLQQPFSSLLWGIIANLGKESFWSQDLTAYKTTCTEIFALPVTLSACRPILR